MKVVILQSNYIPWKGYFDLLHDADVFVFYDEVKYTKNDWRNRNRIYTKDGVQWLSIPVHKDAVKQKISEVPLPNGWQHDHINKLTQAYKKAPFFEQLEAFMKDIYFAGHSHLSGFNQYIIEKIALQLDCKTKIINSAALILEGDRIERLINILKQLNATEYISGPAAAGYLKGQEGLFTDNNITLSYKQYNHYPEYKQLHQPFEQYVSIVDMIANVSWKDMSNNIWTLR
jgi:WbqC-like protein family